MQYDFVAQDVAWEGAYDSYVCTMAEFDDDAHFKSILDAGANYFSSPMWVKDHHINLGVFWSNMCAERGWYFQNVNGKNLK